MPFRTKRQRRKRKAGVMWGGSRKSRNPGCFCCMGSREPVEPVTQEEMARVMQLQTNLLSGNVDEDTRNRMIALQKTQQAALVQHQKANGGQPMDTELMFKQAQQNMEQLTRATGQSKTTSSAFGTQFSQPGSQFSQPSSSQPSGFSQQYSSPFTGSSGIEYAPPFTG